MNLKKADLLLHSLQIQNQCLPTSALHFTSKRPSKSKPRERENYLVTVAGDGEKDKLSANNDGREGETSALSCGLLWVDAFLHSTRRDYFIGKKLERE